MSGSFSLLRQWITSPAVVGTFTIIGVGFFIATLFAVASYFLTDRDCFPFDAVLGICSACLFIATIVVAFVFNDWARTVV